MTATQKREKIIMHFKTEFGVKLKKDNIEVEWTDTLYECLPHVELKDGKNVYIEISKNDIVDNFNETNTQSERNAFIQLLIKSLKKTIKKSV